MRHNAVADIVCDAGDRRRLRRRDQQPPHRCCVPEDRAVVGAIYALLVEMFLDL